MKNYLTKTGLSIAILLIGGVFSVKAQSGADERSSDNEKSREKGTPGKSFDEMSDEELYELSLEDLLNLEITTASKNAEKLSDAAGVISVITRDDINRFGGLTLRDLLERIPGLTASSSFFTDRYTVASRGDQIKINSGHILILINGRPTREIVEGGISSEMYAAFPVNIIERIEVVKGPGSVLYGSNAFSAVVNVITKQEEQSNLAVTGLTGLEGGNGAMAETTLKVGDLVITAAGRYLKKQDFETNYQALNFFDPMNPIDTALTIPDESHALFFDAAYKGLRFTSSYNKYRTTTFSQGFADLSNWSKLFNNLGYEWNVKDNWAVDFNVTYNYATFESENYPGNTRKSNDLVAEITNRINLGEKSTLVVGGLYNYIKGSEDAPIYLFSPDFTEFTIVDSTVSDMSRSSYALYSQLDFWAADNLKLIGGFQANKVRDYNLNIVPRAGFIWYPVERINIKGLYGQAFRAASVNELSLQYQGFYGNPDVKPEKVSTIDLGVNYMGKKLQGGVNYFRNKQSNIITPGLNQDSVYMYLNRGAITFQGVEAELRYYITKQLFFTGGAMYQENKDADDNFNTTPIASFGAKGGLSYASEKGFSISLFDVYQHKLHDRFTNTVFNPAPGAYNVLNLYVDLNVVKLFNIGMDQGINLFVQGNNILDETIWTPDWGGVAGESIPMNQGREVYVGLKLSLR